MLVSFSDWLVLRSASAVALLLCLLLLAAPAPDYTVGVSSNGRSGWKLLSLPAT